jgi:hypothetical protein
MPGVVVSILLWLTHSLAYVGAAHFVQWVFVETMAAKIGFRSAARARERLVERCRRVVDVVEAGCARVCRRRHARLAPSRWRARSTGSAIHLRVEREGACQSLLEASSADQRSVSRV